MFGEPALELTDLLRTDLSGRGIINVLAADQLVLNRACFELLLWLLSELFENLPEVGISTSRSSSSCSTKRICSSEMAPEPCGSGSNRS